jgi:molybdopterin-guanine dinucleotide biosynthesis protein A
MAESPRIAGIVLAGGKSSRMGRDKALLEYQGRPLLHHMMGLLRAAGLSEIFVSGNLPGYPCVPDVSPAAGPVGGIISVVREKQDYDGYLFIPVDMPLLPAQGLRLLLSQDGGAYFIGWPLPLFLVPPAMPSQASSVQGFIKDQGIYPIDIPPTMDNLMKNANTPEEWQKVISKS